MKRTNVDVGLHSMEGPGSVGDDLSDLHQVELKNTIEVLIRHGGPVEGDEGGRESEA